MNLPRKKISVFYGLNDLTESNDSDLDFFVE